MNCDICDHKITDLENRMYNGICKTCVITRKARR